MYRGSNHAAGQVMRDCYWDSWLKCFRLLFTGCLVQILAVFVSFRSTSKTVLQTGARSFVSTLFQVHYSLWSYLWTSHSLRLVSTVKWTTQEHAKHHCLYNDLAMGWLTEILRFDSRQVIFLFSKASRLALGSTQPPTEWVTEALSPEVKQLGHEAEHWPPTCANTEWVL